MNPAVIKETNLRVVEDNSGLYSTQQVEDFVRYYSKYERFLPLNIPMCLAIWKEYPYKPPVIIPEDEEDTKMNIIKVFFIPVCKVLRVEPEAALKAIRKRECVEARQITMYLAKNFTKYPLQIIGEDVGGKDHATVLHANKVVNNLLETDKKYKSKILQILEAVKHKAPELSGKIDKLKNQIQPSD